MANSKTKHETVRLRLLPAPETLSPEEAHAWLDEEAPLFVDALAWALLMKDHKTREAFCSLALDVREMLEACNTAIAGGTVCIERVADDELELPDVLRQLAQIALARPSSRGPTESRSEGQRLIGQRLLDLLNAQSAEAHELREMIDCAIGVA